MSAAHRLLLGSLVAACAALQGCSCEDAGAALTPSSSATSSAQPSPAASSAPTQPSTPSQTGTDSTPAASIGPPLPTRRGPFLKGQLHAHTWGSLDSDTPPHVVVRWYASRGYDFLVITDHNRITAAPQAPSLIVLPGVELTINLRSCDPPPAPGDSCLLHINALLPQRALLTEPWRPSRASPARVDIFGEELDEALRIGAIAQLNHPNFRFAADASTIASLASRGLALLEIANESVDSNNEGDRIHPSTEALWDSALSRGARLFGTATDDAHDYFDDPAEARRFPNAYTGDRGFVMVRAEPDARAIREALARGDFYASNGLVFERADVGPDELLLEVPAAEPVLFEAIGEAGRVLRSERGASFRAVPRELGSAYVRVRATDPRGRRAWTQPVFLDGR